MMRLLIVDDEPEIVEWLFEMLREIPALAEKEVDFYKACTGKQALAMLEEMKFDIVLSDIRMPGLNGLQLLEKIKTLWPECRVAFLTGYDEFDYVYAAIRHEGVKFLLKTEPDEEIVRAIVSFAEELEAQRQNMMLLEEAVQKMEDVRPLLQERWLRGLLEGKAGGPEAFQELQKIGISLRPKERTILVLGGEGWPVVENTGRAGPLEYAVNLELVRYTAPLLRSAHLSYGYQVWLFQADALPAEQDPRVILLENIQSLQETLKKSRGLEWSFAVGVPAEDLSGIPECYLRLKRALDDRIGQGGILLDEAELDADKEEEKKGSGFRENALRQRELQDLQAFLEGNREDAYFEKLSDLLGSLTEAVSLNDPSAQEVYYGVALILLHYLNGYGMFGEGGWEDERRRLLRHDAHGSWKGAQTYFLTLSRRIFRQRESENERETEDGIRKVQDYIRDHLDGDLSLGKVAGILHFNASYFSRLFKQKTGKNLTEYIVEERLKKACELLAGTDRKIYEIAGAVGYDSAHYFARFFKKSTGLTPQEYRELHQKNS